MTAEEMFCALREKYGDALRWEMVPLTESHGELVVEFKEKLPSDDLARSNASVWAVAKSTANNNVLYLISDQSGHEAYRICNLRYTGGTP